MKSKHSVLIVSALLILVPLVVPSWVLFILSKAMFMFIAVLGVTLFLRGGQVTFGHALFYGVGVYTAGFSVKWFGFRDALVLVPVGALAGLIMAALVGLIMARYRGVFFAMLNLAFSMILYAVLLTCSRNGYLSGSSNPGRQLRFLLFLAGDCRPRHFRGLPLPGLAGRLFADGPGGKRDPN
jgi:branched-chain amino acid transport system permease protein